MDSSEPGCGRLLLWLKGGLDVGRADEEEVDEKNDVTCVLLDVLLVVGLAGGCGLPVLVDDGVVELLMIWFELEFGAFALDNDEEVVIEEDVFPPFVADVPVVVL